MMRVFHDTFGHPHFSRYKYLDYKIIFTNYYQEIEDDICPDKAQNYYFKNMNIVSDGILHFSFNYI